VGPGPTRADRKAREPGAARCAAALRRGRADWPRAEMAPLGVAPGVPDSTCRQPHRL